MVVGFFAGGVDLRFHRTVRIKKHTEISNHWGGKDVGTTDHQRN
jgi:hypothetical protein